MFVGSLLVHCARDRGVIFLDQSGVSEEISEGDRVLSVLADTVSVLSLQYLDLLSVSAHNLTKIQLRNFLVLNGLLSAVVELIEAQLSRVYAVSCSLYSTDLLFPFNLGEIDCFLPRFMELDYFFSVLYCFLLLLSLFLRTNSFRDVMGQF